MSIAGILLPRVFKSFCLVLVAFSLIVKAHILRVILSFGLFLFSSDYACACDMSYSYSIAFCYVIRNSLVLHYVVLYYILFDYI